MLQKISTTIESSLADRLATIAQKTGKPTSFYVSQAISEHIEDLEDLALALEGSKSSNETYTLAAFEKRFKEKHGVAIDYSQGS